MVAKTPEGKVIDRLSLTKVAGRYPEELLKNALTTEEAVPLVKIFKLLRATVGEVLVLVGLGDFANAYPNPLSGGMQQRASLARVLAYEPDVLLMDEPFGALDEFTREAMNLELIKLTRPQSITVLFVTHNIPEAVFLADRVVVMSARPGRVVGVISVPFAHPRTIDVMRERKFTDLVFDVRTTLAA